MHITQYQFVKDYHLVAANARWASPEGVAVLDIFPLLIADIPIGRDGPFFEWLRRSKAADAICKAAQADPDRFKPTLDTCEVVLALFK